MRQGILLLAAGVAFAAGAAAEDAKLVIAKPDMARQVDGSAAAPVDPGKYQIGPEDLLFIRVWREPDFTLPVAVRPDGKITMPLIGEVRAAGQSPLPVDRGSEATADAVFE